jgi:tetratricopeptide (TPR) repeat protein
METMGNVYTNLGLYDQAWNLAEEAHRIQRDLHDGDHPEVARSILLLAEVQVSRGNYQEAEELARQDRGS